MLIRTIFWKLRLAALNAGLGRMRGANSFKQFTEPHACLLNFSVNPTFQEPRYECDDRNILFIEAKVKR
jgi:hypothetical protein